MQNGEITIHTDGGSRGNPGPAACAFVVNHNNIEIYKGSKYLGIQTNNFAEYSGVITALEWLYSSLSTRYSLLPITFYLDSELVTRQINGIYKVKDENLKILYFKTLELIKVINRQVIFKNIPREKNKIADHLVNQELDNKH